MTHSTNKFGVDQSKGDEEDLAKELYPNYESLLARCVLSKKIISRNTFVYHRGSVAGNETGVIDCKKISRVRALKDEDWAAAKNVLNQLGWFFRVKESEADGACNGIAFGKLSEAVCAHERMMKDGVSLHDNLNATEGGMFMYSPHVVIIHQ